MDGRAGGPVPVGGPHAPGLTGESRLPIWAMCSVISLRKWPRNLPISRTGTRWTITVDKFRTRRRAQRGVEHSQLAPLIAVASEQYQDQG